jgi:hypothetical protein
MNIEITNTHIIIAFFVILILLHLYMRPKCGCARCSHNDCQKSNMFRFM